MPPALFAQVILDIGLHFVPGLAWTTISLFVLPITAWMADALHHTQLFLKWPEIKVLQLLASHKPISWFHNLLVK
jgi:hypothetical protein